MSSFTTPLVVTPLPDGRRWRLFFSFQYHVGSKYNKDVISVPAGFITDFASVPFFAWSIIPSWGKYGKATVIHDYLYQAKSRSRKEADDIFREAMQVLGVARWKILVMYWSVRIFGFFYWRGR